MSEQLQIRSDFASKTGKRASNQDYVAIFEGNAGQRNRQGIVHAIADGMGGALGGRQAAESTVRSFIDAYYSLPDTLSIERAAGQALVAINRWIHSQRRNDRQLENMATTFSALILRHRHAHIIHIGDSRIYRLREHQLQQLTTDHSHSHPDMKHVIFRAIGFEEDARFDYLKHSLNLHDRFLLCSDGVSGVLSDKRLQSLLQQGGSPDDCVNHIIDAALQAGSQDNVSGLVLDVVGLPPPDHSELANEFEALPIFALPKAGDTVDGFMLNQQVFEGRYSRLFKARDTIENRDVVLKFPHPRIEDEVSQRQAFIRESWITSHSHSPWVIKMITLAPNRQSRLYSVMPCYHCQTLEQRLLCSPKINLEEGVAISLKLAHAIDSLNRKQIFHRDIKPENIMLPEDGGLKLLDLGVARLPGLEEQIKSGVPGTPSFMAPEMFSGEAGNERTEIYALGVTIYRFFSAGHYPYGEQEAFSRPREKKYIPLSRYRPDLPAWLDQILQTATATDPSLRFSDVIELCYQIEDGLANGAKTRISNQSYLDKNPVKFWQNVSLILAIAFFMALISHAL
ncbi:Serine/threonine protein kinase [hydrothermal vent metagenome]|uniref:Serine/threonine protein kinase n=1 Tax=hydrothermal vent metagenome TaxID=652676 RepID=A0A3B1A248_9ZZZZ